MVDDKLKENFKNVNKSFNVVNIHDKIKENNLTWHKSLNDNISLRTTRCTHGTPFN